MIDSKNIFAEEMTRTHPNQSLDTLISLIILSSIWEFAAFPYIQAVRKAAKLQNKNLSFKSALLVPTVSKSALHSTNLFSFCRHHTPTIASHHFLHINPHTFHNSFNRSDEGLTFETSALNSKLFTVANLRYQLSI